MYVIIAPIQIKEGCKEEFVKALLPNAQAAANTEPGCLRFDVIQDAGDPNRCGSTKSTWTRTPSMHTRRRITT